jgi:host factor-I protein
MEKPAQNIQDSFLNNARKDKTAITLYLLSGVKLSGRIKSFDKYSLILETNNQEQLIFKHAISTVVIMKAGHAYAGASQASHGSTAVPPRAAEAAHSESSDA